MSRVRAKRLREPVQPGSTLEERAEMRLHQQLNRRRRPRMGEPDYAPDYERTARSRRDEDRFGAAYALANDDNHLDDGRWTEQRIEARARAYKADAIEAARDFASRPRPFGQWSSAADMPIWYRRPDDAA